MRTFGIKFRKNLGTKLEDSMMLLESVLHQSSPVGRKGEKNGQGGKKEKQLTFVEYLLNVGSVLGVFIDLF